MKEEKRTLEQIEDNELAKLFLQKNHSSKNTRNAEISDLFVHVKEEFFEKNPAPDPELRSRLQREISDYSSLSNQIEKTIEDYKKRQRIIQKINSALNLKVRKLEELSSYNIPFLGADYRYFYTYLTQFKREIKNSWIEFNGFIEITLKAPKNFTRLKRYEIIGAGLLISLIALLLLGKAYLSSSTTHKNIEYLSAHTAFFSNWLSAITILSILSSIFIIFPYIVLGVFYFININYLYKSKYFHYFIILCGFIAMILFLTAFCNFLLYQLINFVGNWGIVDYQWDTKPHEKI